MQRGEASETGGRATEPLMPPVLGSAERKLVLCVAFLSWMFAGLELSMFVLIARPAMLDLLGTTSTEADVGSWFAWYQSATMLGAAAGGWMFGWLGDRR